MKHTPAHLIACLTLGVPLAASAAGARPALVIANSAYEALPPLPGCADSAHTVSAALRRAGFDVTEKPDASNGEMGSAIADFDAAAAASPGAVLYICGYTMNFGGRDFLLPATASIDRGSDALTQGIAAKSLLDAVAGAGSGARLVLLDLVSAPKTDAGAHFDSLAIPSLGLVAAVSAAAPPQGASSLAAAAAAAFAKPDLTLADAVAGIARSGGAPGVTVTHAAPATPAWLVGGRPASEPAAPPAAAQPDEAHMTDADRRRVQAALLRLGYYDRAADGVFGPETRAAIRRFQHEIAAPMTGEITPDEATKLLTSNH